ncbi:hypothetical protein EYF80_061032 [Liparis tanakae]|uniref:Uncharacterized protein n=1 Tax=Liparis tanakae TaxID=230148 RepID=A0A4Z2EJL0_9TELE|nr:hypothetical protein EYF80_061032 [Liparis tanakae]
METLHAHLVPQGNKCWKPQLREGFSRRREEEPHCPQRGVLQEEGREEEPHCPQRGVLQEERRGATLPPADEH